MDGAPFGETVLAWRLFRGLTQAALARAASVPRPNLSAIERGDREVTLVTLRALALALDVRPGALVDGLAPPGHAAAPLGRPALERIAGAVVRRTVLANERDDGLARNLGQITTARLRVAGGTGPRRGDGRSSNRRQSDRAWLALRTQQPAPTVASLLDRLSDRARRP